jgi:homocitrate synthase NifV
MKPVRNIVDTTMRDGEQSPGIAMSQLQKVRIAQILDEIGVYQIEAGIPAIGHCEMDALCEIMQNRKQSKISVWNRMQLEDVKKSIACKPDIIHISTPVSYVQIYSKLNKNKAWVVKNIARCADYAMSCGFEVTIGFEDASRADITFMAALATQLKNIGVARIRFADTVGVLSPSRTYRAVQDIMEFSGMEVEIHAHNDLGMAIANSVAAARAGALFIDTTILGIGERAGNCDFSKLVDVGEGIFQLGLSRFEAFCIQEKIAEILSLHSEAFAF